MIILLPSCFVVVMHSVVGEDAGVPGRIAGTCAVDVVFVGLCSLLA